MEAGSECGADRRNAGVGLFIDEDGGYATIAVAMALLVSVSMVFALASVQWVSSRSADVQEVADACALAGQNPVAGFSTIAQVLDACVVSLGVIGLVVLGIGLVLAVIPGAQGTAKAVTGLGRSLGDARRRFARSAARGLGTLERELPYLVVTNSASCLAANGLGGQGYVGCAIPFPQQSQSDYSALEAEVSADDLEDAAERLRAVSQRAEEAKAAADAARVQGWRADCVDDPSCLMQRAQALAELADPLNPGFDSPLRWNFGVPLARSRSYYLARFVREAATSDGIDELSNSAARKVYYLYALKALNGGHYSETPDGKVDLDLPALPRNADEVRQTAMYTDPLWPTTMEPGGRVLHATAACPGAKGAYAGNASLASQERGEVMACEVCRMDVGDMGKVAAISTSATNGYEHYWKTVVQASQVYQDARNRQVEAEQEVRKISGEGVGALERALDDLQVARPRICPPGAWGCVSVVYRQEGSTGSTGLAGVFTDEVRLPPGAALSAAVLAPDDATDQNNVLSRFFDAVRGEGFSIGGVISGLTGMWGELLVGYGSAYGSVSQEADQALDRIDGVFGGTTGSWLKGKVSAAFADAGLVPADVRLRKPVLTGTREVLDKSGYDGVAKARDLLQRMPDHGTPEEVAHALGLWAYDQIKGRSFTVAELPVPGTDWTIPLTVDLSRLEV